MYRDITRNNINKYNGFNIVINYFFNCITLSPHLVITIRLPDHYCLWGTLKGYSNNAPGFSNFESTIFGKQADKSLTNLTTIEEL